MDLRGFRDVKILVSGGLDEKAIPTLAAAGADGFGVGTSISNAPTIDFALDIVEKEGKPVAKRGKFSGRKHAYQCPKCLSFEVSTEGDKAFPCPQCGAAMRLAEIKLLDHGKRTFDQEEPRLIRQRVMSQIKRLESRE